VFDVTVIGTGPDKKTYNVRAGSKQIWEDELIKQFPDEERAIKK
jgi:hypothetical protein